jgi:DNA-binding response OmpR family regulator
VSDADDCLSGLRVLLVEDELLIAMELENLLRRLGCIVGDAVPTIQQALRMLESELPDFAVLDVNLNGQRVTPVAEALREQSVPFILVTGWGSERLHEEVLRDAPYLRKPVNAQQLALAISDVLARLKHG